ncbi:MAG: WG repeat-containing protein [Clostridia bacterium]|nr:WG repeat-containing protein [Clostridia bacterium]
MSSGAKRYSGEKKKLNMKKIFAVIIALAVIVMVVVGISKLLSGEIGTEEKTVANQYFAVYTNEKWGVINSKGDTIIKPEYDETIIIPDSKKDVFLCTYDVNYIEGSYKAKVINEKGKEIITGYDTIQALENYDDNNNLWYETDALLVSKSGKYGLVDFKGKELLKCEYDSIEALKGVKNSILIQKDGKYGLVDHIGATIIETEYKEIKPISNEYANGYIVTNSSNQKGVIGRDKAIAVEIKYQDVQAIYGNGNYVVKENDKWEIINSEGTIYLKGKFDKVKSIDGQNVVIISNNKYGVVTLTGETKIDTKYQDITYACDDNYIFKEKNQYGIINLAGEKKIKESYESLIYRTESGIFEGDKANLADTDFIGSDLTVKLKGILSEINTELGYMKVRVGSEYKYYNFKFEEKSSKELLKGNTLFLDKKDEKYGYVNKDGIVVVDYIYDDAREQNEFGYASVKKDGMWGCIDSKGKQVIAPSYALENASLIEFIHKWHRGEDLNLNYYTDK